MDLDSKTYNRLKKEVEELKKHTGKQRGEHIKYYINYIRKKEGEEGVKKVQDTLEEMGFDMGDVENLTDTTWVSESIPQAFFLASARIFDWNEQEIFEMGKNIAVRSTVAKVFIKYFPSIKKTLEKGVKNWNNNFTRGKLELHDFDKKEKKVKFILKNFKGHPLACIQFQGFFTRFLELATGSDNVEVEETKCMCRGDDHHEYQFKW